MNTSTSKVNGQGSTVVERLEAIERASRSFMERFDAHRHSVEQRFDTTECRIDRTSDKILARVNQLRGEQARLMTLMTIVASSGWATVAIVMAVLLAAG